MSNNVFSELYHYYQSSRGIGHTTLMEQGTLDYDSSFYLVASSHTYAKDLARLNKKAIPITLEDIENYKIRGMHIPIIFDNSAMIRLIDKYQTTIQTTIKYLQTKNQFLDTENKNLCAEIVMLETELKYAKLSFWKKLQIRFSDFINKF